MKLVYTFVLAILIQMPVAASEATVQVNAPRNGMTKRDQLLYKRNGGMLKRPGTQKGVVYYVNAQKRAPVAWLKQNAAVFADSIKIAIEVKDGTFEFPNPAVQGNATLFVVYDETLPPILLAPESRWCMVNVASLAKGTEQRPQFFAARVQKELTRAFSLLAGAQTSNYPNSLLGCVTKLEDLDLFADCVLPVDIIGRFVPYLDGYGVKPYVLSTYRKAVQEGWAPAPTNDVQKAIWQQVHQIPDKPITIEYDPKRDK